MVLLPYLLLRQSEPVVLPFREGQQRQQLLVRFHRQLEKDGFHLERQQPLVRLRRQLEREDFHFREQQQLLVRCHHRVVVSRSGLREQRASSLGLLLLAPVRKQLLMLLLLQQEQRNRRKANNRLPQRRRRTHPY